MNRYCILTFSFLFFSCIAFAQKDSVYYFSYNNTQVNSWENAGYCRKIKVRDVDEISFTDHYKDGTTTTGIFTGSVQSPRYVGTITWHYRDGNLYLTQQYEGGRLVRTSRYHPNGILLEVIDRNRPGNWPVALVIYEADSAGKISITKGNGTLSETDTLKSHLISEYYTMQGPYKNGAKDGLWKGSDNRGFNFEELYAVGKLISGTTVFNGKKYHYIQTFEYPKFKGNINKTEERIIPSLINRADTLGLRFFKPGYLLLSYVIGEQGYIKDVIGFKKHGLSRVQLQLKGNLPKCTPAKLRGVPIDYAMPTNFDYFVRNNFSLTAVANIYLKGQVQ